MSHTAAHIVNPLGKTPVGLSNFAKLAQGDYCFVDKTLFIKEVLDAGDDVILLTRPRRFGKTLNMSMLQHFLQQPANEEEDLFADLAISRLGEGYQQERGKRPVLFLTLKDVKAENWDDAWIGLRGLLSKTAEIAAREAPLGQLVYDQRDVLEKVIQKRAEPAECKSILAVLTQLLTLKHDGLSPWVLIDEYDTSLHAAYQHDYYPRMRDVIRGLLGQCLKDNADPSQSQTFLHRSVITGILRVAKEDIFSDLNNLGTYGVLDDRFSSSFGFTQPEVKEFLAGRGLADRFNSVRKWYNGYRIGADKPTTMYNPWSVVSYLANPTKVPRPHWVNTSSNELVHSMLEKSDDPQDRADVETLLLGHSVEKDVSDSLALRDLPNLADALWSILLTSGYLTADLNADALGFGTSLRIPNKEVQFVYRRMVANWFHKSSKPNPLPLVLKALVAGDVKGFAQHLTTFAASSLSYFDIGDSEPERVYHALVMGMLAYLSDAYHIRSNRESGMGRPDLLLIPNEPTKKPGIVMEFKVVDAENQLEQAADKALQQIKEKNYHAELLAQGIENVIALGLAFKGKEVCVKHETLTAKRP